MGRAWQRHQFVRWQRTDRRWDRHRNESDEPHSKIDVVNQLAIVEPGVITAKLIQAAQLARIALRTDPSSLQVCTIGGNLAFNSGGAHCLKYGMTSTTYLVLAWCWLTEKLLRSADAA